jgi:Fic family protein
LIRRGADVSQPPIEPYRPFPPFKTFQAAGFTASIFDDFKSQMEEAKSSADPETLQEVIRIATRSAAADTGAIEGLYEVDRGFTVSVAAEAAAWDNIHREKGALVARFMNDALAGYDYVLDLVTGSKPLTEAWIRELHVVLCRSQETHQVQTSLGPQEQELLKGTYKTQANSPLNLARGTIHSYASVEDTPPEMARLVAELASEDFTVAHPVMQAAYAHYAFVCVHPFPDGNGRVARALASVYLYRSPGVPLVIFADQKPEYLDALELADDGDYQRFTRFIGDRARDTVRMVIRRLRSTSSGANHRLETVEIEASLLGRGGLAHEDVDRLAVLMFSYLLDAVQDYVAGLRPLGPMTVEAHEVGTSPMGIELPHLRGMGGAPAIQILAHVGGPAPLRGVLSLRVFIVKSRILDYDFVVMKDNAIEVERFYIRDFAPSLSGAANNMLRSVAEENVEDLIRLVAAEAASALRRAGY